MQIGKKSDGNRDQLDQRKIEVKANLEDLLRAGSERDGGGDGVVFQTQPQPTLESDDFDKFDFFLPEQTMTSIDSSRQEDDDFISSV